jgi:uncharacterized protein (TIGR02145 family)
MNSYFKLVLLTAIFIATTFTFSCSGDDGSDGLNGTNGTDGKNGTDCVLEEDDSGVFKITCGAKGIAFGLCSGIMYNTATHTCENDILKTYFVDPRDNAKYKTLKIGMQTWFTENLNYVADGSECYGEEPANCAKYGRLYTWAGAQGACPTGWILPNNDDWTTLGTVASFTAKEKLMAKSEGGTDDYGFSILFGGYRLGAGSHTGVGTNAAFWSRTEDEDNTKAWAWETRNNTNDIFKWNESKSSLYSIRCIKN